MSQTVNSTTTEYVWDRLNAVPLLVDDGTYGYLHADGLLARVDGSDVASYYLTDALGSVRGLTDGAGDVIGTTSYEVFGTVRSHAGVMGIFGFTGEQKDSVSGFTYLRARYLNPMLGRFVSADSVIPNAQGSQGYSSYTYVANQPCNATDPTGNCLEWAIGGLLDNLLWELIVTTLYFLNALRVNHWQGRSAVLLVLDRAAKFAIGVFLVLLVCLWWFASNNQPDKSKAGSRNDHSPESGSDLKNAPGDFPYTP